ncbi:MAG: hypothetical protein EPN93_17870 [Spirochaetes bacterium]|nr:MAG: hypothetical protein EPN93_17870 [Spirochaetota bacterium]
MRILIIKSISAAIISVALILTGCQPQPEEQPSTLIFSGVESIELVMPLNNTDLSANGGKFTFNLPSEVEFAVIAVFDSTIQTDQKTIINEGNYRAGNHTTLPGFTRDSVDQSDLYVYDPSTNDVDETNSFTPLGITYHWAVYGYDSNGELTHASPQRSFTF